MSEKLSDLLVEELLYGGIKAANSMDKFVRDNSVAILSALRAAEAGGVTEAARAARADARAARAASAARAALAYIAAAKSKGGE